MNIEFEHAIGASLHYGFDYTKWLAVGETIVTSTWVGTTGVTLSDEQVNGGVVSVLATGGEANTIYYLTNTIVTSAPHTDSRTLVLSCKRR